VARNATRPAGSDKADSVNFVALNFARLAATRGRNPADLLRQASSAAWGSGFVQASAALIT